MAAVRGRPRACRVPFTPVFQPAHGCHPTGHAQLNQMLFGVTPNIAASDALNSASEILSAAAHSLEAAATGVCIIDAHQAFLLCHALRAAKATVDALTP